MKSVLIIDDELQICESMNMILEYEGYAAEYTTSAKEGLEKFSSKDFSAVLLDIQMPGLDGYAACEEILALSAHHATIPIIFLTKMKEQHLERLGRDLGAYLQKPVDDELLLETVERLLRQRAVAATSLCSD